MTEPRYRYSGTTTGRRSPTSNPARLSMPVNLGYNPHYNGDVHTVQTARYDAIPRRPATDHKTTTSSNPHTTITTYNVTTDPARGVTKESAPRTSNTARRRSSTVDSGAVKPIIVTTNHASRPHGSTSHTSSSAARAPSPSRDPYRSSDETYYTQPANSMRGRSQHRYGHGYSQSQSATLSNDELYRLRERVGDDRLRAPTHTATDFYRYAVPHAGYTAAPAHDLSNTAVIDYKNDGYENEGYEYTKPGELARYDLDHDRRARAAGTGGRRESLDRAYKRPTVNVEAGRYDARSRGPPPTSAGIDRYNRAAAQGTYDRPSVVLPALPPAPAPPPVGGGGGGLRQIEAPRDPSPERRAVPAARPRPVSLYQDAPARMSHPEEIFRSHDDERLHRRRERDGPTAPSYRDEDVPSRGFGIRTEALEAPPVDRPARSVDRRDLDEQRRQRRDIAVEREPRRRSDESIDYAGSSHDIRKPAAIPNDVVSSRRDDSDSLTRKSSVGGRTRDKIVAGVGAAAAAFGLAPPKDTPKDDDRKVSPRRRDTDDEKDVGSSRAADKYRPRERDIPERRPSPRDEAPVEPRREARRERAESPPASKDRETERERIRERAYERERERERELEKERNQDRERERDRDRDVDSRERDKDRERDRVSERTRRDTEAVINGSSAADDRDNSPSSDGSAGPSRRRRNNPPTFDPTDPEDLLDVKAELAAKDNQEKSKDKPASKERSPEKDVSASVEYTPAESREESRGREVTTTSEKQVRVVSPPREKSESKPIKGILKTPSVKFPEDQNPIREGVAPHKDDKTKKNVPPGARWTKVNRKLISPAALEGKERFEVRDEFVIVLRVLSKEEIQEFATRTAQIRAAKRKELEDENGSGRDRERDRSDEDRRGTNGNSSNTASRRHRRDYDDEYDYRRPRDDDRDGDRARERHRRHRDEDEDGRDRRAIEYDTGSNSTSARHDPRHHRSYRDRDYDSAVVPSEDRR
ncbi:uncharacterized protein F4822DRAFT_125220 [Hypoxylon trugodes]|uniref:uncharacterized protein n=1 Tax=Hypoxylon trugodes TaxID=326681 RepID=UPI002197725F|nr:uncharacterized protein F4822DRAFT_125220 [Hypoxylon trugodes]KAI1392320.1 hypothetical protein F4822DRAFT_125220 [Hypoxylon trugodes]